MRLKDLFKGKTAKPPANNSPLGPSDANNYGAMLVQAADFGDAASIDSALANGADINFCDTMGRTALMIASEENNVDIFTKLMANRADARLVNGFDQSALHMAFRRAASKTIYDGLIGAKAPINLQDRHGATPAFYAAQTGSSDGLESLAKEGADFTVANKDGRTPLMQATGAWHTDAIDVLTKHACALDAQDKEGHTALMLAIFCSNEALVEKFLKLGANVHLKNGEGHTASDLAREKGLSDATLALLDKTANAHIEPFREGASDTITVMKRLSFKTPSGTAS